MTLAAFGAARGQEPADTVRPGIHTVEGKVQLGKRAGPVPVRNAWVVVHRITSDASGRVGGGPLDSARTNSSGSYRILYRYFGDERATYIAITTHAGVSYITAPLTRPNVSGDDAVIMVFDTTTPPYPIRVAGRHFIVTDPDTDDRRRVVEVYELLNDSTLTVISSETNPVWRAPLPPGATNVQLNPAGDITTGTARQDGDWLKVYAPISPGLRQLSFTYSLPASAFPLSMPIVDSIGVFEVLVQEPAAVVQLTGISEVAPVSQEGRQFRRLLGQDIPRNRVLQFTMPAPVSRFEKKGVTIVAVSLATAMALALGFALWLRRRPRGIAHTTDPTEDLIRQLAAMDAEFERRSAPSDAERTEFNAKRTAPKSRLSADLAARSGAS